MILLMKGDRSHHHQDCFVRLEKHVQPGLEENYVKIIIVLMDVNSHTIIRITLSNLA